MSTDDCWLALRTSGRKKVSSGKAPLGDDEFDYCNGLGGQEKGPRISSSDYRYT